jgi:transcriptional regulator with XRE-family HTH domain
MARAHIDVSALHAALDAAREERGESWRQLAKAIGVSPSLLFRLSNGYRPDADGFATLTTWLRLPAETFIVEDDGDQNVDEPELMTQLAPLLRARKDLNKDDVRYLEDVIRATLRRARSMKQSDDANSNDEG